LFAAYSVRRMEKLMSVGLVVLGLVAVGVIVAAAVIAVLHFRFGMFRRRKGRKGGKSGILSESRIEVLERTKVDAERQLVLVRCDGIEHLILVGGPSDVVVENDVKKVRGPGAPAPKPAAAVAAERPAAAPFEPASLAAARPTPAARPAAAPVAKAPPRPGAAPVSDVASRMASASSAPAAAAQRPRAETPLSRSGAQRRTIQPAPLGGSRPDPGQRQAAASRGNGRQDAESPSLPAAGVPWQAPDSIENEIVRALRFDPAPRAGESATKPRPPVAPKKSTADPSTTLGDLAEKLEEALAEEVQSAGHARRKHEVDLDEFAFDIQGGGAAAPRVSAEPASRPAAKKETATPAMAPAPEPERRRESPAPSERREEAPVISLNSRRRESSDPLEDEMARLLGELTGDTKGR
jgi:hypothetical protein